MASTLPVTPGDVPLTHPEKVLFPDDGITKGEVAAYYQALAPVMLPHLRGRPITMERYPAGIDLKGFIQKDVAKGFPSWLKRVEVPKKGGTVRHLLVNDVASLRWMVNQNTVTPHVWTSRLPALNHPDLCVFDLDPADDQEPDGLREMTLALRDLLDARGHRSWVKTSGSKGFHIVIRVVGQLAKGAVARLANRLGREFVTKYPDQLTQEFTKVDRRGRIYVDTGRNGYSATFAAPYAVRPKRGAPVSAPCTWEEVDSGAVTPQTFTLRTMPARVTAVGDLWSELV